MQKLQWDSEFWGIDIYDLGKDYDNVIPKPIEEPSKEYIVQALLEENEIDAINSLEDKGFRFVETKVNLIKQVSTPLKVTEHFIRNVKYDDLLPYKDSFYDIYGKYSRFSLFNPEKVNNFYYMWLKNSIEGTMDHKCMGYYVQDKLAGFITYKIRNQELSIGLFGVFPEFQQKGIGKELLNHVNNQALNEGCKIISVSTQGKNYNAINIYIKNNFLIRNLQNWYYLMKIK